MASEPYEEIREAIRALCQNFPGAYWQKLDAEQRYPDEFVAALTAAGWMAALIPQEYDGAGLGLAEASVILEEINRNGGNSGACHGQLYNMGTLLRHGSEQQKRAYLPRIARGELRLQSMAVTEQIIGQLTAQIQPGRSERDLAAFVHARFAELGLPPAWPLEGCPIVNCGPASDLGHTYPSEKIHAKLYILTFVDGVCLANDTVGEFGRVDRSQ